MKKFLVILFLILPNVALADFSPDGKQIVFSSNVGNGSQIFISSADGKNSKQIARILFCMSVYDYELCQNSNQFQQIMSFDFTCTRTFLTNTITSSADLLVFAFAKR